MAGTTISRRKFIAVSGVVATAGVANISAGFDMAFARLS